ncbi:hypothetical protein BDP27DRAFT_1216330 [Rhodocollybia butyracea]|uniref:ZW10 C-terminal helical domain-containing protein n=1 Tax=Rhodocollybia butyracea TaxID=206335 RepID=A0A9P5Q285_9AGAR|nr:hypothetical protein BDP27DRAFT_1216330 [Rhodocollybia butyracea]
MAFPVPSHLPRPQDVTSKILSTMDEATTKSLTASLAKSWLEELDATILHTKERIHDRIHADLPEFERQLQTSIAVQTRLRTLTSEVDSLNHALSDPESGLVPSLVKTLTAHSALAQITTNARIKHEALSHLSRCRKEFLALEGLVQNGDLPEAVDTCLCMEQLLKDAPVALAQSNVLLDLKRRFNATKARTEEQLSDSYLRCVSVTSHGLTVAPSVQVRQTERTLNLPRILSALSSTSLDNHLNALRRDITIHYIETLLTQSMSVVQDEFRLTCFPSPPNDEVIGLRIENLSRTLQFLSAHLFAHLPAPQHSSFPRSLCKPVISSVLNNLLIPNLPSSFNRLPSFLELMKDAVGFEETCIIGLLGNDRTDKPIKTWANGIGGHYERQRRMHLLETTRSMIIELDTFSDTFLVEVEVVQPTLESAVQGPIAEDAEVDDDGWGFKEESSPGKEVEDSWGFDDEVNADTDTKVDDDGWGFDDAAEALPDPDPVANGHEEPEVEEDAWGLDDDAKQPAEDETLWDDDPWGEGVSTHTEAPPHPSAVSIKSPPKIATRLEKLANKGKKDLNGNSPLMATPVSPNLSSSSPAISSNSPVVGFKPHSSPSQPSVGKLVEKRPPKLSVPTPSKENYVVSTRMKGILAVVRETLHEAEEFVDSRILPATSESNSVPGSSLFQTSASILDLYRALYPVAFSGLLQSLEGPMRFSNNCLYLSAEIEVLAKELRGLGVEIVKQRLDECSRALKLSSDSWYGDAIEKQRQVVDTILSDGTRGLPSTGDQDRYDECENAMNRVLQEIRRVSQKWKGILTKSKYYTALGSVTDAALSRVLQDVLELGDIPELESHRLSELCRILLALEGLYVEDPEQPSFVVAYVPSWLKFSYLSELLEASLADITYLFEEGALVDFEVEELTRLVRALFADTSLRTNTINKIMNGHPIPT